MPLIGNDNNNPVALDVYTVNIANGSAHDLVITSATFSYSSNYAEASLSLNNISVRQGSTQVGSTISQPYINDLPFNFQVVAPSYNRVILTLKTDLAGWGTFNFYLKKITVLDKVTGAAATLNYGQAGSAAAFGPDIVLVNTDHLAVQLAVYPKSYNAADSDTLYVLPNEYIYSSGDLETAAYNFLPQALSAVNSGISVDASFLSFGNWEFTLPWLDDLSSLGLVTKSETPVEAPQNQTVIWSANATSHGIDKIDFGWLSGDNTLPVGATANIYFYGETVLYNQSCTNPIYNYLGRTRTVKSIDGLLGDVNGDGQVDNSDRTLLQQLYTDNGGFTDTYQYTEGINVGRAEILFDAPTLEDIYLLGIWLNDHTDPLVKDLGIGSLMSTRTRATPVGYSTIVVGNTVQINTAAYAVRIYTILPTGKMWSRTARVSNGQATFAVPNAKLKYKVEAVSFKTITSINDLKNLPVEFNLSQNYPNPFNPTTTINYSVPKATPVTLKIYDILGREVATLVNEEKPVGNYTINFNAAKLASGTYIYRLTAGTFIQVKKMILMK
jgi:hypothetical protein